MLLITDHAVYRYAKRVFYQKVCDKKRDLPAKSFSITKAHAKKATAHLEGVTDGKYPIGNAGIRAVIRGGVVVTFLYS